MNSEALNPLREFIKYGKLQPKKSLSQNFLIDESIPQRIVDFSQIKEGATVLEIGPGGGALTLPLLEAGANVIAVEKDYKLANRLQKLNLPNLIVIEGDILDLNLAEIIPKNTKIKVCANLPYQVTTPIISHLINSKELFLDCTVMVQEEVGRRFAAKPKDSNRGHVTLYLEYHGSVEFGFVVDRTCFNPTPKVQSAVIKFIPAQSPYIKDTSKFFEMTKTAFHQKRKMLRGTLKKLYGTKVVEELLTMGLLETTRPQEISLEQWIELFNSLNP